MAKEAKERESGKEFHSMDHGLQGQGPSRGSSKEGGGWKESSHEGGGGKESNHEGGGWKEFPNTNMPGEKETKKGCFPKVLMLLLPLLTVGAYFLLRF